jgi:hypothetical protein
MTKNKALIVAAIFVFCYSFIIIRAFFVPLVNNNGSRNAIHGDSYSDQNTYSAAMFFKDFGFKASGYLPVWHYKGDRDVSELKNPYTHYPSLPDILAGSYAIFFNSYDSRVLRIIPVLISVLFFFLIFYTLEKLLPDKRAAFLSAIIIVLSNYFLFWADNLHKHLYEELFKWIYVLLLFIYYETEAKKKLLLITMAVIYLIVSNISFEPIIFLSVVTVGFTWIYQRKIISVENILLLSAPIFGFALHVYQNYHYLGSWNLVVEDFKSAFIQRTIGGDALLNELHRSINIMDYLRLPYIYLNRI